MIVDDAQLPVPGGTLFARSWTPSAEALHRPALLLFHDSLGCVDLWRDFPERLADACGRRVVAYDRLGFGRSDARNDRLAIGFVGEEARRVVPVLLDALGIARLVPVGHSVGGAMAVATAAHWPARCDAVVTIASQAFVEDRTVAGIREAQAAFADPHHRERLSRYHGAKADWVLAAWTDTWLSPDFAHWNQDAQLRRLQCPLLAVHGDRDEYGSLAHPRRLVDEAGPEARMLVLDGCGHVPHREQPERLAGAVADFVTAGG